jgi:hypothetical protein
MHAYVGWKEQILNYLNMNKQTRLDHLQSFQSKHKSYF